MVSVRRRRPPIHYHHHNSNSRGWFSISPYQLLLLGFVIIQSGNLIRKVWQQQQNVVSPISTNNNNNNNRNQFAGGNNPLQAALSDSKVRLGGLQRVAEEEAEKQPFTDNDDHKQSIDVGTKKDENIPPLAETPQKMKEDEKKEEDHSEQKKENKDKVKSEKKPTENKDEEKKEEGGKLPHLAEKEEHLESHKESPDELEREDIVKGELDNLKKREAENKGAVVALGVDGTVIQKHGTGPTQFGYVLDFVKERAILHLMNRTVQLETHEDHVAELLGREATLQSCHVVQNNRIINICEQNTHQELIVFNGADFSRFLCGKEIPPGQAMKLREECNEPNHVFQQNAPLSGKNMPPVQILAKDKSNPEFENVSCDIPCQWDKSALKTVKAGKAQELQLQGADKWQILMTWADPYNDGNAKIERTAFKQDYYYSTMSRQSSVPLSLYDFDKYSLRNRPPIEYEKASNKASYVLDSDCSASGIRRHKWFAAVEAAFDTAAYGSCQHNIDLKEGETVGTMEGRIALQKKNRIALVFEGGNERDYVTEQVWESLLSGAVPAILGSTNLGTILPPNSAILASSFNHWDKFAAFVKTVSENKTLWESYHAWRTNESVIATFENMFEFTKTTPQCRMCRWAYAKRYGLGWDHYLQQLRENSIPRRFCVDDESPQLITNPLREVWLHQGSGLRPKGKKESCVHMSGETSFEIDGNKVQRSVWYHDGVVDITIDKVDRSASDNEPIILRLEFSVRNTNGAIFQDSHTLVPSKSVSLISSGTIQDLHAKVTVLADFSTVIRSPEEGIVEIEVLAPKDKMLKNEKKRIRIIPEDYGELHDKLTEFFPSSFGKKMMQDFMEPLELYFTSKDDSAAVTSK